MVVSSGTTLFRLMCFLNKAPLRAKSKYYEPSISIANLLISCTNTLIYWFQLTLLLKYISLIYFNWVYSTTIAILCIWVQKEWQSQKNLNLLLAYYSVNTLYSIILLLSSANFVSQTLCNVAISGDITAVKRSCPLKRCNGFMNHVTVCRALFSIK